GRGREPRDGRLPAGWWDEGGLRTRLLALPAVARTPRPACGDPFGRRAADGGDGPGADVAPQAAADGRAVNGAGADPRRAQLRDHQRGTRIRRPSPRGRAERDRRSGKRRPRLRAPDRADRVVGTGGRATPTRRSA